MAEQNLMYHGTPAANLKTIQKIGLRPMIGDNKETGEDDDPRYPRVHLTKSLTTAKWYAKGGVNAKPFSHKRQIKGVVLVIDVDLLPNHRFMNDPHEHMAVMTAKPIPPDAIVDVLPA
jgi:hypothetical protein